MSSVSQIEAVRTVLYRTEYPAGVLNFGELYVDALARALRLSRLDAEAKASDRAIAMGWTYMQKRLAAEEDRGLSPLFRITSVQNREVVWLPHDSNSPRSRDFERQRRLVSCRCAILNAIDALTSREFE